MQATIRGEFLAVEPVKSGKGNLLSLLQEKASCDLYVPNDVAIPKIERMAKLEIAAVIRPGYEGRGFQATAQNITAKQ